MHAQRIPDAHPSIAMLGGQLPVTCERCNICTVTGEGSSILFINRSAECLVLYRSMDLQLYNSLLFDPANKDHQAIQAGLATLTLHRCPGKVRPSDFGLNLANGLKPDSILTLPIPGGKGLSCFDLHNVALEGPCHVVRASSLKNCSCESLPTEIFVLKSDPSVQLAIGYDQLLR